MQDNYFLEFINHNCKAEKDSVFEELRELDNDIELVLYKLAFKTYNGFDKI